MVEQHVHRADAGSSPSRPLHFRRATLKEIAAYVKTNHYHHSVPVGVTDCYGIFSSGNVLLGAAIFGFGAGNPRSYWGLPQCLFRELTRLVLSDALPANSESLFLGWCLRQLAATHRELIAAITYADPAHGHSGTIYRATNWHYLGQFKAHRGTGRGLYSPVPKHKFIYVFPGKRGN